MNRSGSLANWFASPADRSFLAFGGFVGVSVKGKGRGEGRRFREVLKGYFAVGIVGKILFLL